MSTPRFLTPARVVLLALMELYVAEAVPNHAFLSVCSFLAAQLIEGGPSEAGTTAARNWMKAQRTVRTIISIQDFETLLSPHMAAIGLPGRRLWDVFLKRLWDLNSLHKMQEFFEYVSLMLALGREEKRQMAEAGQELPPEGAIRFTKNSPCGKFVRRCCVEFFRLRFHDVGYLWKEFVRYRQPTAEYLSRRMSNFGALSFDSVLLEGQHEWLDRTGDVASVVYGDMFVDPGAVQLPVSSEDAEKLLEFQVEQMQRYSTRVPPRLKHQFQFLLKEVSMLPSLSHYLNFLEAWRSGDYPTSFDCLHRYFDYTMQNRDRLFYQYALLNLAVLQADFGCYKDAVSAMLETVSTARENRDNSCLNFALNWLYHFGQAHPEFVGQLESNSMLGSRKESLAYMRVKAKETGAWPLWSSSLLSEAKMGMAHGESVATAAEYMVRSSQVIVQKNLKALMGPQLSMSIALWERLGQTSLSRMTCEVFLRCHARNATFDEELKTTARLASLLACRGKYDEAMVKLEGIDQNSLRTWKSNQFWRRYRGILKLRRDLHRNDLDSAEHLLSQLLQGHPDDPHSDISTLVDTLHIEYLERRGDLQAAFAKVEKLLEELNNKDHDVTLRIRLILIKAHLYDRAGRPQRGFTLSMRAARLAWRARIMPLLWQAIGAVANVLISLGEFESAAQLLLPIIPRCIEIESGSVVAQLYSLLADAYVGAAGQVDIATAAGAGAAKRADLNRRAHAALEKAVARYAAVEDVEKQCEMLAKQATIMMSLGEKALAKVYLDQYRVVRNIPELAL